MKAWIGVVVCLMWCTVDAHFFNEKSKGWHWYQRAAGPDRQCDASSKKTKPELKQKHSAPPKSASEELSEQRKLLEEALAESVLRPTQANVSKYQQLQQQWLNKSQAFATAWHHNLLQHPDLDVTVKNPVTQYGIQIKKEDDQRQLESRIKALSKHYGLFFVYSGTCKFCKGMAGIVQQLSEKYGWKVLAISQDGVMLPEFPDSKRDNGLSQSWGIRNVPAVFVVNPEEERVIPIGYGLISLSQLESNLILQLFKGGR